MSLKPTRVLHRYVFTLNAVAWALAEAGVCLAWVPTRGRIIGLGVVEVWA